MIGLYHSPPIWLHKWPAGLKLGLLAGATWTLFFLTGWHVILACLALTLTIYFLAGPQVAKRLRLLKPLAPFLLIIALLQYFTNGWDAAIVSIGRLLTMILLADLVTMSTPMQAMLDVFNFILRPLALLGVRVESIALAIALVIRFVPLVLENWRRHEESWRARSPRRPGWRLLRPFLADTLRLADHAAEALDARRGAVATRKPETEN